MSVSNAGLELYLKGSTNETDQVSMKFNTNKGSGLFKSAFKTCGTASYSVCGTKAASDNASTEDGSEADGIGGWVEVAYKEEDNAVITVSTRFRS